jgi:DNA-binding XRE family transcriptional regulator
MEFGQRLKEVRKHNSLSQVELAKMLGFHSITVSRWERSVVSSPVIKCPKVAVKKCSKAAGGMCIW